MNERGDRATHRPRPMTQHGFHRVSQLSETQVVFGDLEQRVVTKSGRSRPFVQDAARTMGFAFKPNGPSRIRDYRVTRVMRGPPIEGNALQSLQQEIVVLFVGRVRTGESRRADTRFPSQRVDRQTAVFRQNPVPQMFGLHNRFESRVFGERRARFGNIQRVGKLPKHQKRESVRRQQLQQLLFFFGVMRPQNQCKCRHRNAVAPVDQRRSSVDIQPSGLVSGQPGRTIKRTSKERGSNVNSPHHFEIRAAQPQRSAIDVGNGLLHRLAEILRVDLKDRTAALISDEHVFSLYGKPVAEQLTRLSRRVETMVLPAGESTKSTERLAELWRQFARTNLHRDSLVVAIGGGVVGDLAGFAAATFARGMPWVVLPTSLISQVDSAIGGKVGVNLEQAKNLIGAFWQPVQVIVDPDTLVSLSDRDFRSGLAEVVKYAVIHGEPMMKRIEQNADRIVAREPAALLDVVARCCRIKADIVQADPWEERGGRVVLNYGHTFGHAFETTFGYGQLSHGEAVAMGMTCAARLARRLGLVDDRFCQMQLALLSRFDLPTKVPSHDRDRVVEAMMRDKKNRAGKLRFVLPRGLGKLELIDHVTSAQVFEALRSDFQPSEEPA